MLPFAGGSRPSIDALADELVAIDGIEGVTFSGGEPFMQAAALVALIDRIKSRRQLSFMSFTGFTLDELRAAGESAQLDLLARLDLLVDGRYRRDQHATLMWRGSRNQTVHFLSSRYSHLRNGVDQAVVSIDVTIDASGSFGWAGIPPKGLRKAIERGMADRSVSLAVIGGSL